jgi:hypothetical protein
VTFGGSGRDGLGALRDADSFSSRRRLLLVDESAASAEAADASNAIWPKLEEVPPRLRCSGCELTLAALHARAATAARRLRPPSWIVADHETKEALVFDNWNGACGALAADAELRVIDGEFFAGDAFITRVWEDATEAVLNEETIRRNATGGNGTETERGGVNATNGAVEDANATDKTASSAAVAAVADVFVPGGLSSGRRPGRLQRDARGDFGVRAAAPRRAREGAPHRSGRLGRRVPVRAFGS